MKSIYAAYAGIFSLTFLLFVNVKTFGNYESIVLYALIVLAALIVMVIDYKDRVPTHILVGHALLLIGLNALIAAIIYLVGFSSHLMLLLPIFMVQGALFYVSLERRAKS